jgi:uncharacterized protein (TIGR03435 family)
MTKFAAALVIAGIVNAAALRAQTQSAATASPKFEVVSVKPAVPRPPAAGGAGERGDGVTCAEVFRMDRSRADIECGSLRTLIAYASRFYPARVTGPNWMEGPGSPKFDIAAKLPEGASENQVPEMVEALLVDRFKLTVHRARTEQEIYALVVAKGGLKVKAAGLSDAVAAVDPDCAGQHAGTNRWGADSYARDPGCNGP